MQLFYAPNIESDLELPIEEARHCFSVLRKKSGDEINVVDGKGNLYNCSIVNDNVKKNELFIKSKTENFNSIDNSIHIAISPTKNMDRMEWFVEKAVEIGVSKISFILTQNSERRKLKLERLEKKAVSAMKQSLKASIPILSELEAYQSFVKEVHHKHKFITHLDDSVVYLSEELKSSKVNSGCILIGPEGGFVEEEVEMAKAKGFKVVSLGKSRLRTETAGIVALTLLNQI